MKKYKEIVVEECNHVFREWCVACDWWMNYYAKCIKVGHPDPVLKCVACGEIKELLEDKK